MFEVIIKTPYNTIQFATESIDDDEVKEILDQPWVEDVEIKKVKNTNLKRLVRRQEHEGRHNQHNE